MSKFKLSRTNRTARCRWSLIAIVASSLLVLVSDLATANEEAKPSGVNQAEQKPTQMPANHRSAEPEDTGRSAKSTGNKKTTQRRGRQYDTSMGTASTGTYAAAMTGDSTGAYLGGGGGGSGSLPLASGAMQSATYGDPGAYHDQSAIGRAYPHLASGAYGPMPPPPPPPAFGGSALGAMFPSPFGGSGSAGFPLMAKGFDITEIVCTAIAVAIGAVIVGAPFILLYLFIMNQMQANGGPGAMGPGGGSISLTGPTATTNVGGRKKRHTTFPEALLKQLSPFVNSEQLAQSFKMLINSIAKYQA